MRKRYNTPHRSRVVKTRMTEEECIAVDFYDIGNSERLILNANC